MGKKHKASIISDPRILSGKLIVKGTRLSVDFILSLFGAGWSEKQVLENYPMLSKKDLTEVFNYAAHILEEEKFLPAPKKAQSR